MTIAAPKGSFSYGISMKRINLCLIALTLTLSSCGIFQPKYSKPKTYDEKARAVLIEFSPLLQECYTKELLRTGVPLAGAVTFKINIKSTGRVKLVKLIDDSLRNKRIKGCFVKTIHKIKFPTHDSVKAVQVNQPFMFKPPRN